MLRKTNIIFHEQKNMIPFFSINNKEIAIPLFLLFYFCFIKLRLMAFVWPGRLEYVKNNDYIQHLLGKKTRPSLLELGRRSHVGKCETLRQRYLRYGDFRFHC